MLAVLTLSGNAARAQALSTSDSAIVHHVGAAILRELYYRSARGAFADSVRPVRVSLPTGVYWQRIERHILLTLRGRLPDGNDRIEQFVRVDDVAMKGDTLVAHFSIGDLKHCGDAWVGDYTQFEAKAIRHGPAWEPVTTKAVLFSDGVWCRAPDA